MKILKEIPRHSLPNSYFRNNWISLCLVAGIFIIMNSGVYKLFWTTCNYYYYGQAVNFKKRESIHLAHLKKGAHHSIKLQNVYNKYGFPKMEIIETCDLDKLNEREQHYLDMFFGKKECCNIQPSARSSLGVKRREETKRKLSASKTGVPSPRKGIFGVVKQTEATKLKHSTNNKGKGNPFYGKKHSAEVVQKIKLRTSTPESIKVSINNLKKITAEHRQKRLLKIIGRKHTEESKQKTRDTFKKKREIKEKLIKKFKKTSQLYINL